MDAHLKVQSQMQFVTQYSCTFTRMVIFAFENDALQVVQGMRMAGDRTFEWSEKTEILRRAEQTSRMTQWGSTLPSQN